MRSVGPNQSTLPGFVERPDIEAAERRPGSITNTIGSLDTTGVTDLDISVRVGSIHVVGVLHRQPLAIARVAGAIARYDPDVVAVEAKGEAVRQYHPDICDPRWPPSHELEAAAFATAREEDLIIAGIDTRDDEVTADFEQFDREIFTELGLIESEDDLTLDTYYELDLPTIRDWRDMTRERDPDAFESVLAARDDVMAGHLRVLHEQNIVDTIVAAVGVQHLSGIVDRLRHPDRIPDRAVEHPPFHHYNILTPAPW